MNMREWNLGLRDPLSLTLAADARLCQSNYADDQIWELELGSGEPAALSLRTTFGLRARSMRVFPRFSEIGQTVVAPESFAVPPRLKRFYPNFFIFEFSPFDGIDVTAEYWAPESQAVACRLTMVNRAPMERKLTLDVCALLSPLDGESFSPKQIQMVNVLTGRTGNLEPVLFATGGPVAGVGAYPALSLDLAMGPSEKRELTWVLAAWGDVRASFELARRTAARSWDAERARLELVNASQTIDIQTGDPDWDAALAFSQKTALGLLFNGGSQLPQPSFVSVRQPDNGYSRQDGGRDHPASWSGQTPLECYFLNSVLPGAPEFAQGLLRNFLSVQSEGGFIDGKPGLGGQRGKYLAAPMIASLAWQYYLSSQDEEFLEQSFPALLKFFWAWFSPANDRNRDGLPEWEHLVQTGFEENPLHDVWNPWSQGVEINCVQSPALLAMLFRESQSLMSIAKTLDQQADINLLELQAEKLREAVESSWDAQVALYRYQDRDTHLCLKSKVLGKQKGTGDLSLVKKFDPPIRVLLEIQTKTPAAAHPELTIHEYVTKLGVEKLAGRQFQWRAGGLVGTSQKTYTRLGKVKIKGLDSKDKVTVRSVDYTSQDHTLLLPLWAGIPDYQRAQSLIGRSILDAERFDRPFGIPACLSLSDPQAESICQSVYMPWNVLVGEGLLAYGFQSEAARLTAHLMNAVIQNLKKNRSFYQFYHAETGTGIGERNALGGLAPVGLFLKTLGIRRLLPDQVEFSGLNPYPWQVTVKYRGLTIACYNDRSEVRFANGETVVVKEKLPCSVSL
jgi:hypothetical protein